MNAFVQSVARVLEVDSVGLDDEFRNVPGWCSLHAFGLLVMLENDWHAPIGIEKLSALSSVKDLYREAFVAFAAEVLGVERGEIGGDTARGSIPQWDSVAHLRLVMEAEKRFGTYYPIETIPSLSRIDDFLVA